MFTRVVSKPMFTVPLQNGMLLAPVKLQRMFITIVWVRGLVA